MGWPNIFDLLSDMKPQRSIELDIDLHNWCLNFSPYFDIWFISFQFKTLFHVFSILFIFIFIFIFKISYTCLQHMHQKHEELLII
jgi:hypothetical protein